MRSLFQKVVPTSDTVPCMSSALTAGRGLQGIVKLNTVERPLPFP